MASFTAIEAALISELEKNPSLSISDALTIGIKIFFPPPPRWYAPTMWAVIGILGLVLLLSTSGLYFHCRNQTVRLYTTNDAGVWRPSLMVLPQACFALYAALNIGYLCGLITSFPPASWCVGMQNASFIPLGLTIHVMLHASILAPNTKILIRSSSSTKRQLHGEQYNWLVRVLEPRRTSFLFAIFIPAMFVTATVVTTSIRLVTYKSLLRDIDEVRAQGVQLDGTNFATAFVLLKPLIFRLLSDISRNNLPSLAEASIYVFFVVFWFGLYFPSATALALSLRRQQKRIDQSLQNCERLDQLVTNPSEKVASEAPGLTSPPIERTKAKRSGAQVEELQRLRFKTAKLRLTIEAQLAFVTSSGLAMLAADCYLIYEFAKSSSDSYIYPMSAWTAWAFAVPCLLASIVFFRSSLQSEATESEDEVPITSSRELDNNQSFRPSMSATEDAVDSVPTLGLQVGRPAPAIVRDQWQWRSTRGWTGSSSWTESKHQSDDNESTWVALQTLGSQKWRPSQWGIKSSDE